LSTICSPKKPWSAKLRAFVPGGKVILAAFLILVVAGLWMAKQNLLFVLGIWRGEQDSDRCKTKSLLFPC
jgi:hypothetical protein